MRTPAPHAKKTLDSYSVIPRGTFFLMLSTQPSKQGANHFLNFKNAYLLVVSGEKYPFFCMLKQKIIVKIFAYFLTKNLHQKQRKITAKKLACFSYKKFHVFEALSKLF